MCHPAPLKRLMLEALRARASGMELIEIERWLHSHDLSEPISELTRVVMDARPDQSAFGHPDGGVAKPLEEGLLDALGLAICRPEQIATTLAPWLPTSSALQAEGLLLEISSRLVRARQRRIASESAKQPARQTPPIRP